MSFIGEKCFASCYRLRDIIIPPQLEIINPSTFMSTAIERIKLDYGVFVNKDAFKNCTNLKTVEIFDHCTLYIASFSLCNAIEHVVFYEYVTIYEGAFDKIKNVSYYGLVDYWSDDTYNQLHALNIKTINVIPEYVSTKYADIPVRFVNFSNNYYQQYNPNDSDIQELPISVPNPGIPFYRQYRRLNVKRRR